jgi:RNA polymerase sigma-70 factor (ECF subfamily)
VRTPQGTVELRSRDTDWAALIKQIAGGDQSALANLYDSTCRLVFGLALRILGDAATAEEVVLDVYTQVWRQASSYDHNRGGPLSWLMTIGRSRAIDRLRSGRQEQQRKQPLESIGSEAAGAPDPEESSVISERQSLVRAALAELSPEQRQVIELAYYSGLSQTEIAARLGQPLGTVKTRSRLGMMKLRDMLSPVLENDL